MDRPFVTVYAEVSADGKSTHRRGCSSIPMMALEDAAVRRFRHELRAASDAIMVGSNTVRLDDPSLTVRHVPGSNPLRVIPAAKGDLPLGSKILTDGHATLIAVSEAAPSHQVASLRERGAEVVYAGSSTIDLAQLLSLLHQRGISSMMIEGGATLLASVFRSRLADRILVQHLPVIFGGDDVPSMVGGAAMQSIDEALKLRLVEAKTVGGHAVMDYQVEQ
jgi:5-amino-6-(5-phosphoribosylamino)uracil reductase